MPSIALLPAAAATARLTSGLAGWAWLEFEATLAPATNLRFAPDGRPFPAHGTVSIRRGADQSASGERIADAFRYIAACTDDDTGEPIAERFGVTLFMDEAAIDRLVARAHWGLPALVLYFDPTSDVITLQAPGKVDDLFFRAQPRSWEKIVNATLTQRLAA